MATGPYTKSQTNKFSAMTRIWYRQARPYVHPLPFTYREGMCAYTNDGHEATYYKGLADSMTVTGLYSKAYDRMVDLLGDTAGMGINLAQYRQSASMISARANQLAAFTGSLKRRSPLGMASALGISKGDVTSILGRRYGLAKSLANLWLEFHFGWSPLISDIYSACRVFSQDIRTAPIKGSARTPIEYLRPGQGPFTCSYSFKGTSSVRVGCRVRLVNPNLHLANSLGLLNPAVVIWDAIPWSFVLGWVSNIDTYLRSLSDFAGWETSDGYRTYFTKVMGSTSWASYPGTGSAGHSVAVTREVFSQPPRPSLQLQISELRPVRALTAISLLTQKLRSI